MSRRTSSAPDHQRSSTKTITREMTTPIATMRATVTPRLHAEHA